MCPNQYMYTIDFKNHNYIIKGSLWSHTNDQLYDIVSWIKALQSSLYTKFQTILEFLAFITSELVRMLQVTKNYAYT